MGSNYELFGCVNNIDNNSLTNISKDNKKFSIKDCAEVAERNNSNVFGLVREKNNSIKNEGSCFISDSSISPLQQTFNSIKNGLIFQGCPDNFGEKSENSMSIFVNNNALSFFDDIKENNNNNSQEKFTNELNSLIKKFSERIKYLVIYSTRNFKSYESDNVERIFNSPEAIDVRSINNIRQNLKKNIISENNKILIEILKLNKEIKILDDQIIKAREKLQSIISSDNAAYGSLSDTNSRNNVIIIENIILILLPLLLIFLFLKEKK